MEMGDNAEIAVLAGGCAWIMQQLLRHPEGVISTRTGFMGGENVNPTEETNIGHAEVVEVVFDPVRLPYRGLLEVFFQVHRADLDEGIVGSQYRSEIFYTSPEGSVALGDRAPWLNEPWKNQRASISSSNATRT